LYNAKELKRGKKNMFKMKGKMIGLILCIGLINNIVASEIVILPGETIVVNSPKTVRCVHGGEDKIVTKQLPSKEKTCQYFDEHNGVCQFTQTVYRFAGQECINRCSHWDEHEEKCLFEEKCEYNERKKEIISESCDLFDEQENRCLKTKTKVWRSRK
jgi:hypothetical protein